MDIKEKIIHMAEAYKEDMAGFLIDIIKIPSISGQEQEVALRIKEEMIKVGFDSVFLDGLGNVIGRIGNGKTVIAMDAHMDTVDVGDRELWQLDPFDGIIQDGIIYGRGAADQKSAVASIIYAVKIIKELGLEDDYTLYVTCTVLKEECDGLAWHYIINEDGIVPHFVIITEPTNLNIYTGHRGRVEFEIITKGLSCDASSPQRGINAIYKTVPIIHQLEELNRNFKEDSLLGKASVAVTQIYFNTPSKASIPDECKIKIDRRITTGENSSKALREIKTLKGLENSKVKIVKCKKPSYTGVVYPLNKYSPSWCIENESAFLKAAMETYRKMFDKEPKIDKWRLSTNGSATMGEYKIPTIGFGPGNEIFAHGPREQVAVEQLIKACEFYVMFPQNIIKLR